MCTLNYYNGHLSHLIEFRCICETLKCVRDMSFMNYLTNGPSLASPFAVSFLGLLKSWNSWNWTFFSDKKSLDYFPSNAIRWWSCFVCKSCTQSNYVSSISKTQLTDSIDPNSKQINHWKWNGVKNLFEDFAFFFFFSFFLHFGFARIVQDLVQHTTSKPREKNPCRMICVECGSTCWIITEGGFVWDLSAT